MMITRTPAQAVAAVAQVHRWTSLRSCEWLSSAPAVAERALMRGGNHGSPDFMRR